MWKKMFTDKPKAIRSPLFILLILTVGISAVTFFFVKTQKEDVKTKEQMQKEMLPILCENRTAYLGNASQVGTLINQLPGTSNWKYSGMKMQTTEEPYELTISYQFYAKGQNKAELTKLEEVMKLEYTNTILLMALIENMGICNIELYQGDALIGSIQSDRLSLEEYFGSLYPYSENAAGMEELLSKIEEADSYSYLACHDATLKTLVFVQEGEQVFSLLEQEKNRCK